MCCPRETELEPNPERAVRTCDPREYRARLVRFTGFGPAGPLYRTTFPDALFADIRGESI